jgi:hypothetical protein
MELFKYMRPWRKISIVVGIASCVAVLVPVIHHYQLRFALTRYIAELKAQGEPMELTQVLPTSVPPEQNGVPFIQNLLTNLGHRNILTTNPPPAMYVVAPGRGLVGWRQADIRTSGGTNKWEDLGRELTAAKSTLAGFQNLTNHPVLDFQLDYQQGLTLELPHLLPLRRAAELLKASTLYNLHQGNVTAACADVRTLLALVQGQSEELFIISQSDRMNTVRDGTAATWEILQTPNISETDLERLQQAWQSLEFIKPLEQAYLMERAVTPPSLDRYRRQPDELWRRIIGLKPLGKLLFYNQWRWFWSYADEKHALQSSQVLIEATRLTETNRSFQSAHGFTTTNFVRLGFEKPGDGDFSPRIDIDVFAMRSLFSEGAHHSFRFLKKAFAAETAREVAITAIAIRRYQLRHHQLPGTLQDLIPILLKAAPLDWMDGQPLRYRPNADGTYLLYSVGENGKDDDGDPSPEKPAQNGDGSNGSWQNPLALDWVWPQPATPEEIQTFCTDQARKPK